MDAFNQGPADLVVIVPLTTTDRGIPLHVPVVPPEGGLRVPSFAMCENVRSVARERLVRRLGAVSQGTMTTAADRLRILLNL